MGLLSISFAYFFLVVATLAWFARRRPRVRNALLLAASYTFYATWQAQVASWLLVVSVLDWVVGEALARMRSPRARRVLVTAGVLANAGLLAGQDLDRAATLVPAGLAKKVVLAGYLSTHLVGEVFMGVELERALRARSPSLSVERLGKLSTGLAWPDVFDWPAAAGAGRRRSPGSGHRQLPRQRRAATGSPNVTTSCLSRRKRSPSKATCLSVDAVS